LLKHSFFILLILSEITLAQSVHRLIVDRFNHFKLEDWISYAPAQEITSIDIDEDHIYFGSRSGGILRYDKYRDSWKFPFTTSSGLRSNKIIRVVYNPTDGFLYAQTPAGIDVYKPAERFWRASSRTRMPAGREPEISGLPDFRKDNMNNFRYPLFYRPSNQELPDFFTDVSLIYHLGGFIYDRYNREFKFTDRVIDSWQRLWIGTDGIGLMKSEMDNFFLESKPQSIPNISPRDIFINENELWIGGIRTRGLIGGITYWDREDDTWQYYEASLTSHLYNDDVSSIAGDKDYVAFGTNHGLALLDRKNSNWISFDTRDGLEGNKIFDVMMYGDTIYIASEYGFNWLDVKSKIIFESHQTILDNVRINQLAYDGQCIWAATRYGLYRIDLNTDNITFISSRAVIPDNNLTALEIIDDQIWIVNNWGIAYWDRTNDEWHSFPDLGIQSEIRDIAQTKNAVWFATDQGLLKYDRKRNYWRLFTDRDGLISNNTYHIDPAGRHLWISTDRGITSFRWQRKGRID
jgi:hypothetical protein